jgi:hypothetical protein
MIPAEDQRPVQGMGCDVAALSAAGGDCTSKRILLVGTAERRISARLGGAGEIRGK